MAPVVCGARTYMVHVQAGHGQQAERVMVPQEDVFPTIDALSSTTLQQLAAGRFCAEHIRFNVPGAPALLQAVVTPMGHLDVVSGHGGHLQSALVASLARRRAERQVERIKRDAKAWHADIYQPSQAPVQVLADRLNSRADAVERRVDTNPLQHAADFHRLLDDLGGFALDSIREAIPDVF